MPAFDSTPEGILINEDGTKLAVSESQTINTSSQPALLLGALRPDGTATFVNLADDGALKISISGSGLLPSISSSTDNAVVRWDGTTGTAIQNSNATLSDAGTLSLVGDLNIAGNLNAVVGGDLTGSLPTPQVIAFTSGATQITFDNIMDGEILQRVGDLIVSISTSSFGGGAVDSVFGRTGAVVAVAGDYSGSQVTFVPSGDIAATDVQAAIVEVRDDTDTKLAGKVDTSTQIIAGAGLTGGGDLTTDRTLDVVANGDGSIVVNANDIQVGVVSDAQHGSRGGGTLHSEATTSVAGFFAAADKEALNIVVTSSLNFVTGPASATDNALVRWDGTTGKLVQNSNAILTDGGSLSIVGDVNVTGNLNASVSGDLQGTLPSPQVIAFTSGSTQISYDNIPEGTFLRRSGSFVIGDTVTSIITSSSGISVVDSVGGTALASTPSWTDVPLNFTNAKSDDFSHTEPSSTVLVNTTGSYLVGGHVTIFQNGGNGRSAAEIRLVKNTGDGFTEVSGTRGAIYSRLNSQGEGTAGFTVFLNLPTTASFKLQARKISGAGNLFLREDGSGLTIVNTRGVKGERGEKGSAGSGTTINVNNQGSPVSGTPFDLLNFNFGFTVADGGGGEVDIEVDDSGTLSSVEAGDTSIDGTADGFARKDHQHAVSTGTPSTIIPDQANAEGISTNLARADHIHNVPAAVPVDITPEAGNSEGVASSFARSDHVHNIPSGTPSTITPDLPNAEGTANSFARTDHIHNVPTDTAVDIGAGGTSIEGTSNSFARADHVHRIIDPSSEASATGNISTTSASPTTAAGMSITPGAGTYLVWFSTWGLHSRNFAELAIGIAVAGTDVAASERRWGNTNQSDGGSATLATQARVTITAGQAIQGRFWRASGGGSVEINDRTLTILKVDG